MPIKTATRSVLWKKAFLKISQNFTGKHLCRWLFLLQIVIKFRNSRPEVFWVLLTILWNSPGHLRPATLLKRHWCVPAKFAKFWRTSFFHRIYPGDCSWMKQDYKFSEDFRGNSSLQYCGWTDKNPKDGANNNWYDKKKLKTPHRPRGVSRLLSPKHKILTTLPP